jgi:hypothetical protein
MTGLAQGIEIAQALTRENALLQRIATLLCYAYFVLALTFSASAGTATRAASINARFVPLWTLVAALATGIPVLYPAAVSLAQTITGLTLVFFVPLVFFLIRRVPVGRLPSLYPSRAAAALEAAFFALGILLCAAVIIWNVALPRAMNSVGVVFTGLGFWTFFFTMMLVVWPRRLGLPSLVLVGVGIVMLFAAWNDNHYFHGCEYLTFADGSHRPWCKGGWNQTQWTQPPQRFDDHVKSWLRANCLAKAHNKRPCPVIFVAAEGGGARAAYWTGLVLNDLQRASYGEFSKHLFALSTVSGGTLGATAFLGSLAHPNAPPAALQTFTGDDFLSPILAALLFPEVIQRFWPWPIDPFDRSNAFEDSLEASWQKIFQSDDFSKDFLGFWTPDSERTGPAIFMNSTIVESGIPFVISNLDLPVPYHERSYYAFDQNRLYHITSLPLSAAVHLSSRFSYVNPPAALYGRISNAALSSREECVDPNSTCAHEIVPWGRLVDGGYYDNSGTETLLDVILATKRIVDQLPPKDPLRAVVPEYLVLVLTNGADIGFDPDPQFDGELLPQRPREPAWQYFVRNGSGKRHLAWADPVKRIAYGTTWSKYIGESDLTSPPQAFFMVGGNHSINDQWALAMLTGQLAIATVESCYNGLKGQTSTVDALKLCLPNIPTNLSPRPENGCPSIKNSSLTGSSQVQQIAAIIAKPEDALSCRTFVNFQKLSFARIEVTIHMLDPSGQFARPALGWELSDPSQHALDSAACAGFEDQRAGQANCGEALNFDYRQVAETLHSYASPTVSTSNSAERVRAFVLHANLPHCPKLEHRQALQRRLHFYRLADGSLCTTRR